MWILNYGHECGTKGEILHWKMTIENKKKVKVITIA